MTSERSLGCTRDREFDSLIAAEARALELGVWGAGQCLNTLWVFFGLSAVQHTAMACCSPKSSAEVVVVFYLVAFADRFLGLQNFAL